MNPRGSRPAPAARAVRLLPYFLALSAAAALAAGRATPPPDRPVTIDFYFEPGCMECERVKSQVLPQIAANYAGLYTLNSWDLGIQTNYLRLVESLDRLGGARDAEVFTIVGGRYALQGLAEIARGLRPALDRCLQVGEPSPPPRTGRSAREIIAGQLREFTFLGVAVAGLSDGLNPCAFSTLIFFISLLSVAKIRGRLLLAAGTAFCAASFLTYFAIGFGLLRALHLFWGFESLRRAINAGMIVVLLIFAALSFVDAIRYGITRRPETVTLQLPERLKSWTHRIMRDRLKPGRLLLSGFVIGTLVTLLESVCTGQVYVPTLVYVIKSGGGAGRSLGYLTVYNLAFVIPLVIVFLLTWQGLKLQTLLRWGPRDVIVGKVLLGALFLLLAGLIAVL